MDQINGMAVLVVGAIWIGACSVLVIALGARRDSSPHSRGALLAVADEFLAVARQAEHSERYRERAGLLLDVLRTQLAAESPALHHADAIISTLAIPRDEALEYGPRMDFHRTMFAGAIWDNVDRVTVRRSVTRTEDAPRVRRATRPSLRRLSRR
ncbi:MAG: hypothetical protein QOG33_1627 [Gaiellales bacterium]|jgi:hypothetical protein|nr:hypothetical protein [Gaiellales bacterium]